MNEKRFKKSLMKALRDKGLTVFDTDIMSQCTPGHPDIVVYNENNYVMVELKMDEGGFTKAQDVFYRKYDNLNTIIIRHTKNFDYKKTVSIIIASTKVFF